MRKSDHGFGLRIFLFLVMIALILGSGVLIVMSISLADRDWPAEHLEYEISIPLETVQSETEEPVETTLPQPVHVTAAATIGTMGDLLMHKPIFDDFTEYNAEVQQPDGSYDFSSVFRYLKEYTVSVDFAVANLETTLCGTDNGYAYNGYPLFNCPDEVVDGVKNAGFDMLLTANNHSYDTGMVGFRRTLNVIRDKGLKTLGTYLSDEEQKWTIQEINGIKIGMLCYTYATSDTEDGRPSLNLNAAMSESGLCNYFCANDLDSFYEDISGHLTDMEQAGAEATVIFMHWGQEYVLTENEQQNSIAQKLCDLGVDVIIGGHPHVIQPVELLTNSSDPQKKTVCLYSLGNAVSNQRKGKLNAISTAHTEDGILFSVTFEKYSDGTVYLAEVNVLPTWVYMRNNQRGKTEYNILPLDEDCREEWQQLFTLNETMLKCAEDSYERTMDIVGDGIEESNTFLAQQKKTREAYYLSLVS